MVVSFIGGGNRNTQKKAPTCRKSLTHFITYCCSEYTSPWTWFELTALVIVRVYGNPMIATTSAHGIYLEMIQIQNTSSTIYRNVSKLFWNTNLLFFEEIYSIPWTLIYRLNYNKRQYIICFNKIIDWLRDLDAHFAYEAVLYHLIGLVLSIVTITQCNLSGDLNARQVYFTQDKLHLINNVGAFLS